MRKKGIALLAALLLALLAGCGANGAAQPEQIDEPAVDPNLSPTAAFMAALQEDEVTKVALCGGQLAAASPEQMWKALNNAATHEITESEACYDLGYSVSGCQWEVTVSVPADVLRLSCGLAENVVVVQSERLSARESCQRTAYFNDSDLYELVRCSRDGSTRIDQSAYETFQSQVDGKLQALLAKRADDPAGYDGCVLTGFAQVWSLIAVQIFRQVDDLLQAAAMVAHFHTGLKLRVFALIHFIQLRRQIIQLVQIFIFAQLAIKAVHIAVIVRDEPFLIGLAEVVPLADADTLEYLLQFLGGGGKLHPLAHKLALVVLAKIGDEGGKGIILVVTVIRHIRSSFSFAYFWEIPA